MTAPTAATASPGGTGAIAHVGDAPVYTAPASHSFYIAPAGHTYIAPAQRSSGIGIHTDHSA